MAKTRIDDAVDLTVAADLDPELPAVEVVEKGATVVPDAPAITGRDS